MYNLHRSVGSQLEQPTNYNTKRIFVRCNALLLLLVFLLEQDRSRYSLARNMK